MFGRAFHPTVYRKFGKILFQVAIIANTARLNYVLMRKNYEIVKTFWTCSLMSILHRLYANLRSTKSFAFSPALFELCSEVSQVYDVFSAAELTARTLSSAVLMLTTFTLSKMRKRLAVWWLPALSSTVSTTAYTPGNRSSVGFTKPMWMFLLQRWFS